MAPEEKAAPPKTLPPAAASVLYQMATGHYLSRALHLAANLGIADQLKDGPRPVGELAQATATHAPSLHRVLRLLASAGVLTERDDGTFGLTPIGECLRTDIPDSAHAMVKLFAGPRIQDNWRDLEYCVRTGEPAFRKRGIDRSLRGPGPGGGGRTSTPRWPTSPGSSRWRSPPPTTSRRFRTVVDVGGGNGALLIGILKANPEPARHRLRPARRRRAGDERRSRRAGSPSAAGPSAATSSRRCRSGGDA